MLSIHPIGSSTAEVSYYATLGDQENHDYYSEDGHRPGEWWGVGAKAMGLSGEVNRTQFEQLLRGFSPDGETQLVQNAGHKKRRSAFDLTWSVPKSWSAAWSQADKESRGELDECANRALQRALESTQRLCGITRRGHAGHEQQEAGLVGAIFRHDTARGIDGEVPDAQNHFHAVILNVVSRPDGTTGALDGRGGLFRRGMKLTLGALFRAELSKEAEALGLRTHRPQKAGKRERESWFELTAVPSSLVRAMSKRRQQVEKWMLERGLSGAKAAEQAALQTRESKGRFASDELFSSWRALGREHGFSTREVEAAINEGNKQVVNEYTQKQLVYERAIGRLMESRSRFSELELTRFVAEESQCLGLGIDAVEEVVLKALTTSKEVVRLREVDGERQYTTREMLATEKRMLESVRSLSHRSGHSIPYEDVEAAIRDVPSLRADQKQAIKHITTGTDVACVCGIAGSGKSFTLRVVKDVLERAGYDVVGTTLAAKASRGLEVDSGIRSQHIHKLLREIETGGLSVGSHSILVVDESGMVGTRLMERLTSLVQRAGAKLVLVGDHLQLQAVSAGAPFRVIGEEVGVSELTKIIRQREQWARDVVYGLRGGNAEKALGELQSRGQLYIGQSRDDALSQLVEDWKAVALDRGNDLRANVAFAGTNLEVRELNLRCQLERKRADELGTASLELGGATYYVGDRVMVTKNCRSLCLQNGMMGELTDIQGEHIRVRLDEGLHISVDTSEFEHLALGYCLSVHKSQGITVENAWVLTGDSMTDREMSYVEASRARGTTRFYSDEPSASDVTELARLMNRSRQKDLATEHLLRQEM